MTTPPSAESPTRHFWTDALIDVLQHPADGSRHTPAARLLELFACPSRQAELEAMLLDQGRERWVRKYLLRAMSRASIPVTGQAYGLVLDEFAEAVGVPWPDPNDPTAAEPFADVYNVAALVALATSTSQRDAALRFLASLNASVTRELLLWDRRCLHRLDAAALDVLQRRSIEQGGVVDPAQPAGFAKRVCLTPPPDFESLPEAELARFLHPMNPQEAHRPLFLWALQSRRPEFQYGGLYGLIELDDERLEPALVSRFLGSEEPLLRLVALGAAARSGDLGAVGELKQAVYDAPHVVLRAQALRSLRRAAPLPSDYVGTCITALQQDVETFDGFWYAPATSEAALGLARHPELAESTSLAALVDAGLNLTNDEAWFAIESAIRSWLDPKRAAINPVWYRMYLKAGGTEVHSPSV